MLKSRFIVVCEPSRFEMMSLTDIAQEAAAFAQGERALEIEFIRAALRKQRLVRTDSPEYRKMEQQRLTENNLEMSTSNA